MSAAVYHSVDRTLLLISEARERAETASRIAQSSGLGRVHEALGEADRELLALHRRLLERVYPNASPASVQLRLDSSQS